ncbi:MAG: hypothetical protein AAF617_08435, partial [Bacteroidota bacterium]
MKTKVLLTLLLVNFTALAQVSVFDNVSTPPRSLQENNGLLYTRLNAEIRVWNALPQNTDVAIVGSGTGSADGFVIENDMLYYTNESGNNVVRWDLNNFTLTYLGNNFSDGINPDYITIVNGTIFITADLPNSGGSVKALLFYDNNSDSFFIANGLGSGEITGITSDGTTIYILKRSGVLLTVDVSNFNYQVTNLNNTLGNDTHGLEIINDLVYYTD